MRLLRLINKYSALRERATLRYFALLFGEIVPNSVVYAKIRDTPLGYPIFLCRPHETHSKGTVRHRHITPLKIRTFFGILSLCLLRAKVFTMEILFSDANLVVCVKPVGLDSEHDMPPALKEVLGGEIFPVHRLDKNVGGVMVFARNKKTAAYLSGLNQKGLMVKEYVALVHGAPPAAGDWEDLLFKDSRKNKVFVVNRQRAGVKYARLEFVRLKDSLVRIRLHTGRSHQIRVQFASRGFPLVGDRKYGATDHANAPMLFSCCITFPYETEEKRFEYLPPWA